MLTGLFNLNKPVGPTSFQMIHRLRRLTGVRKIGHAGTLDPLAGGVLPICIGRAVRLSEYLMGDVKVYRAEITFGIRTTTDDREGEVIARQAVALDRAELEAMLPPFTGDIEQVPPQYAAIKVDGRPMYELARRGQTVDAAARAVHVERLTLLDWQSPVAEIEIECGKGTYVRALARDLGELAGCGAYLTGLTRTRCGAFDIAEAVSLDVLEQSPDWRAHLLPMEFGLRGWTRVDVDDAQAARVLNGMTVPWPLPEAGPALVRAHGPDGNFFAIMRADSAHACLRPEKVFKDTDADE
ncbi:MAG: tRNA pseudouridine(55) synthase TruB [Chloroflexi bacterium]|nr:tRNA pseudouridine(55) synthase TruB [Chloroflexota bacterium]